MFPGMIADRVVSLVDVYSKGISKDWMRKRAAHEAFMFADILPEPGFAHAHVIALGDKEYYGFNRNGDGFLSKAGSVTIPFPKDGNPLLHIKGGNRESCHTFEKYAKVYRDHDNKDPSKAFGDVVKALHNPRMGRVELLIKLPIEKWAEDLTTLDKGDDIGVSMSCRVPGDTCAICKNYATKRADYCEHAKHYLGQMHKSGHVCGVYNDDPVFFDISRVGRPADRIAYMLYKAASDRVVGGAELAEEYGMIDVRPETLQLLQKLASMEKEIEVNGIAPCEAFSVMPSDEAGEKVIDLSSTCEGNSDRIVEALKGLTDAKIVLSVRDFVALLLGKRDNSFVEKVEEQVPGCFSRMLSEGGPKDTFDLERSSGIPSSIERLISGMIPGLSLDDVPAGKRVIVMSIRKGPVSTVKFAEAGDPQVKKMARLYADYKLAFCNRFKAQSDVVKMAVAQNYVRLFRPA
jgi:hypothetical protein